MILYLDTSALVKLYVAEEGSGEVSDAVARCETTTTSLLAYVEARSALARKQRWGGLQTPAYVIALEQFESDWPSYSAVGVDPHLVREAASLAEKHGLRAGDAVHLASAQLVSKADNVLVTFLCADRRLTEAAQAEGLEAQLVGQ